MRNILSDLTAEYVREILNYDPDTGVFTWKVRKKGRQIGRSAGVKGRTDISIRIDYKIYKAHRLAWLYMTGEWPVNLIDHKDRDQFNNRWLNLREASYSENARNRKGDYDSISKLKGVVPAEKKWSARIFVNGKQLYLGTFESKADAHEAYKQAAKYYYGDFARWDESLTSPLWGY